MLCFTFGHPEHKPTSSEMSLVFCFQSLLKESERDEPRRVEPAEPLYGLGLGLGHSCGPALFVGISIEIETLIIYYLGDS